MRTNPQETDVARSIHSRLRKIEEALDPKPEGPGIMVRLTSPGKPDLHFELCRGPGPDFDSWRKIDDATDLTDNEPRAMNVLTQGQHAYRNEVP